jgi:hypothetical protein
MKIATLALAMVFAAAAAAQPPPQGAETTDPEEPVSEAPVRERPADSDERFVPSENISEDLSVSFPADI